MNQRSADTGHEFILVVEDEPDVCKFLGIALRRKGYRVLTADDGQQGLDEFTTYMDSIDLVIFDLILPEMSGNRLFAEMRRLKEHCKYIVTSGQHNSRLTEGSLALADGHLTKPYSTSDLLQMVRDVLDN